MSGKLPTTPLPPKPIPLTKKEQTLINASWPSISRLWNSICSAAFKRWFQSYPELLNIFHVESLTPLDQTMIQNEMADHLDKMKGVFDHVVANIFNQDRIHSFLVNLGKRHRSYGASPKYAQSLSMNLKASIAAFERWDLETMNAWDSLIQFVVEYIRIGLRLKE